LSAPPLSVRVVPRWTTPSWVGRRFGVAKYEPSIRQQARAYAGRAAEIVVTMGRYALGAEARGVKNGLRAMRTLTRDLASQLGAPLEAAVECPICGWTGPKFGPAYYVDAYRENVHCYRCGSTDRCRLVKLYVERHLADFFATPRRRVLDIGPVRYSRSFFPDDADYLSFDLYSELAMVRGDLCAAPLPDASADLWLCFHVLDLIPDDQAAMRELFRVLAPGGIGLLDHVMSWTGPTEEFGGPRARDSGHLRRYGVDLPDRLRAIGFGVTIVDATEALDAETRRRFGIHPRRFLRVTRAPAAATETT
jgi:SAM-dependent methyltransferase